MFFKEKERMDYLILDSKEILNKYILLNYKMPRGTGTYGNKVGRPPKKINRQKKNKNKK